MKFFMKICLAFFILTTFGFSSSTTVSDKIADLNIGLNNYIVGKKLTDEQIIIAKANNIEKVVPGTYKFKDKDIFVVASKFDDRVLVIYKSYSKVDKKKIHSLLGSAIMDFGDPTAMAHDKMVYWSYAADGSKISEDQLQAYKDEINGKPSSGTLIESINKKVSAKNFEPFVTIKLSCSKEIMSKEVLFDDATAYVLFSSSKLIEKMQSQMVKK